VSPARVPGPSSDGNPPVLRATTPLDEPCPTCDAEPGVPCSILGAGGAPREVMWFHGKRIGL
jgi:hypothetical protein